MIESEDIIKSVTNESKTQKQVIFELNTIIKDIKDYILTYSKNTFRCPKCGSQDLRQFKHEQYQRCNECGKVIE